MTRLQDLFRLRHVPLDPPYGDLSRLDRLDGLGVQGPEPLIVAEFSVRAMTQSLHVEGSEAWVSVTTTDGTEVLLPLSLPREAWPLPVPERCEYVDENGHGCPWLVAPNGPEDGRCEIHESTRRGD